MIRYLWRVFFCGFLLLNGIVEGFCQPDFSIPPDSQKFFEKVRNKNRVNLPFGINWKEYQNGKSASGRKVKPWSYVPPFQHHLADYIFSHQNDVGLLYLYLQEVPTPLQSVPSPLPTLKPKLPSKYTADAHPSLIVVGKPSGPAPTPIPFGRAISQAKQLFQAQQYAQAIQQFETAALSQPENPVIYLGLMFSYLESEEYTQAAAMLHRALELHAGWYKSPVNPGLFYENNMTFRSSIQSMETYAEDHPKEYEVKWLLGYCYFMQDNKQKATGILDAVIQAKPEYAEAEKLRQQLQP